MMIEEINFEDGETFVQEESLAGWIMDKVESWRDHYENNYERQHDEYYRIWRGVWAAEDKTRESERSRLISPATQQAVESSVAEIEEATFGRGPWFDIEDDANDQEKGDIEFLKNRLHDDFRKQKIRKAIAEALINAAVYGTGIAEVVLEEVKEMAPATQPIMDGQLQAVGVNIKERTVVKMRPIQPQNFLIDPAACTIDEALGCAIDEFVPVHTIQQLQEKGVYRKIAISSMQNDLDLEEDKTLTAPESYKARKTTYYGLVPRALLKAAQEDGMEVEELGVGEDEEDSYYVEAIVVLANGGDLLKAEANPYMMQDRPVVAFPWDVVPGRFWGRGICEKGYNSQKALDAELRARQDALALTVHPMMGIDSTRLPRGMTTDVRPGKTILTIGRPSEIIEPINLGQVNQVTFAQAESLQRMLQMATGAIDSAGIPGSINGEATAAGISMSLGAIIKRHKRTLINFQDAFIIPFVEKAAWRYMQFDPESYPVSDYKFVATSSLGIIAREYEVTQLVQLLQTMSQESPLYPVLIQSIIDNMSLSNREELIAAMQQAQQPSPEQQQAQQMAMEADMRFKNSQSAALESQAAESNARAEKILMERSAIPVELRIKLAQAASNNLKESDNGNEFEKRLKLLQALLEERKVAVLEKKEQREASAADMESELMRRLTSE
jgi:hypothetical protein